MNRDNRPAPTRRKPARVNGSISSRAPHKRPFAAIAAVALAGALAVGGTIAWLTDDADPVVNTFQPASVPITVVEGFDGATKENVKIQNEGNVRAYIRAYATVNWVDADGNVVANVPDGYSYEPADPFVEAEGWELGADGFYYYLTPVEANDNDQATTDDMTGILIKSIKQSNSGEDYSLQVDIVAQSVQADGVSADGTPAVADAWSSGVSGIDGNKKLVVIDKTTGAGN